MILWVLRERKRGNANSNRRNTNNSHNLSYMPILESAKATFDIEFSQGDKIRYTN